MFRFKKCQIKKTNLRIFSFNKCSNSDDFQIESCLDFEDLKFVLIFKKKLRSKIVQTLKFKFENCPDFQNFQI
jgi:hypothetical protein